MERALASAVALAAGPDERGDVPVWDLSDLFSGRDDARIEEVLGEADREAGTLALTYKGKLGETSGDGLAALIRSYEACEEKLGRVMSFASLLHSAQRDDVEIGRFYQAIQERVNAIETKLLFVTLELNKLEDEALEGRLAELEALRAYGSWLRDVRNYRPHQLDDEIERVLHEKHITGRSAWVRLFDETLAALRFPMRGKDLSAQEIFDHLSSKDRDERAEAAASIAGVLERNKSLFARITNTLAKDKAIEDGWRHFERPISSRNLANQVEDEVVDGADRRGPGRLSPHLAPLLRAQGQVDGPREARILGPQRAAARGCRHTPPLARGQGHRPRRLSALLAQAGRPARELLRQGLDRRAGPAPARTAEPSATRPCPRRTPMC